jgi:uncharacterized membrane protein YagU involved in acid resistance
MRESYSSRSVPGLPTGDVSNDAVSKPVTLDGRSGVRLFASTVLAGGFVAGTIDIAAASLINGANPSVILQAIASGLVGKSAFGGGATTVLLGLLLQWGMSIIIATIFVAATQVSPVLKRRWVKAGLAYGVVVFAVMNYVVLPLSAVGHAPRFRIAHFLEDMVAMLLFGLIVAFFARQREASA